MNSLDTPENNGRRNQASNLIKIFLFFALVIIVVSTAGIAYLNSSGIDIKNISIKQFIDDKLLLKEKEGIEFSVLEYRYDVNTHPEFCTHKGFIVKCSKDSVKYIDSKSEEVWTYSIAMIRPIVKAAGDYLLVADINGKDIIVFSGMNKIWEKKLDNNITNADISASGYVTVTHKNDMARSAVTVYNRQGIRLFDKGKAENYIISSKVSPSGRKVLINSVHVSGPNASTLLELTDIAGKNLTGEKPEENIIYPSIMFIDDNSLFAVGDSKLKILGKDMEEKWQMPIDGNVYSSCIAWGKYAVAAISSGSGILEAEKAEVLVLDSDGKKLSSYLVNDEVKNINAYEGLIAVNTGKHVHFLDTAGKLLGKYNSKMEINEVYFLKDKVIAAVMKDSVEIVEIK